MKHHIVNHMTKGKERNLKSFYNAMMELISEHQFDDITVSEICEKSHFPRATFYNYFYDKFDLLNYCWYKVTEDIDVEMDEHDSSEEVLLNAFDQLYTLFTDNSGYVGRLLRHNAFDSILVNSFSEYLKHMIKDEFNQCLNRNQSAMPVELLSSHYSNTILLLLEWIFIEQHKLSIDEAHLYLKKLLHSMAEESA
jgi:AcrR family transcriptional regulator